MRIVHCFRSPVGGLFRHVRDLAEAQAAAGHQVGVVADSSTGGAAADAAFAAMSGSLALGVHRFPMRREIAPSDIAATFRLVGEVRSLHPDVLHGHGAKGGAYARIIGTLLRASGTSVARIYTPHGGSLHYPGASLKGRVYFTAEHVLGWMTDAFIFVSQYEADAFAAKVGRLKKPVTVVLNGVKPDEFEAVLPAPDARDFLFIGELRALKGTDTFIEALALMRDLDGHGPTAVIVGGGAEEQHYRSMAAERGLAGDVIFRPPMPAREAFALARTVVIPSRAESLPYIVLEAAAAGRPLVATAVGGIPEIFGDEAGRLVPPANPMKLADAMQATLADRSGAVAAAERLKASVRQRFSVAAMAAAIGVAYQGVVAH